QYNKIMSSVVNVSPADAVSVRDEDLGEPPSYSATMEDFDPDDMRPDSASSPSRPQAEMTTMNLATSTLQRRKVRKDAAKTAVKKGWSDNKYHLNRALKHTVMQLQVSGRNSLGSKPLRI